MRFASAGTYTISNGADVMRAMIAVTMAIGAAWCFWAVQPQDAYGYYFLAAATSFAIAAFGFVAEARAANKVWKDVSRG